MKLYEILIDLNDNNMHYLLQNLRKSKCPLAKNDLLRMLLGDSIFQACSSECGEFASIILLND